MGNTYTPNEIETRLRPIFRTYGIKKAVLFGSYAKGVATDQSDVDLVIDCSQRGLKF